MSTDKENVEAEKLLSPPPYEFCSPVQQQPTSPIVINNTTVVQQIAVPILTLPVEAVDPLSFSIDTPKPVRRVFIRLVQSWAFIPLITCHHLLVFQQSFFGNFNTISSY